MASGRLDLQYVGLLLSNTNSKSQVDRHTSGDLRNLVMLSFGMDDPNGMVDQCFDGLEQSDNGDSD